MPYFEKEELDDMRERAEAIYSQTGHYRRRYGKFEEHVEIDKLDGMYECIEVPEFEDSEPATVVHDFEKVSWACSYLKHLPIQFILWSFKWHLNELTCK